MEKILKQIQQNLEELQRILNEVEKRIGYIFKNPNLLMQAFIRRSYAKENGGVDNEVLEFIGDKALDLAIINILLEHFGKYSNINEVIDGKEINGVFFIPLKDEGKLTELKKSIVEKKSLAQFMDNLGFHKYLIMGEGDRVGDVNDNNSVKEDLFEAIIGAVTLDCNYNNEIIIDVVKHMIDFDQVFNKEYIDTNYVGLVQTWFQKHSQDLPSYTYNLVKDEYICKLYLNYMGIELNSIGFGISQAKARMDCAKRFYSSLVCNNLIRNELAEEIGVIDPAKAIALINELVQKELIKTPTYIYSERKDTNGNSIWTCTISLRGENVSYTHESSSKKEATRLCALAMLNYLKNKK